MIKQKLDLKLQQKLSPQQIQLMKIIELSTLDFEQYLNEFVEENPTLEKENDPLTDTSETEPYQDDIPAYRLKSNNYRNREYDKPFVHEMSYSFHEHLLQQLECFGLNDEYFKIAFFLVGSLDSNGYLTEEMLDLLDDLAFSGGIFTDEKTVEKILTTVVQELEPVGVGARNLRECLLIQLKKKPLKNIARKNALEIIDNHFEAFSNRHFEKLSKKSAISKEEIKKALVEIEKLNPKPGNSFQSKAVQEKQFITPDFTIEIIGEELKLTLEKTNEPFLKIAKSSEKMIARYEQNAAKNKAEKEALVFLQNKINTSRDFIAAVKERGDTLKKTMTAIMRAQKEYLLSGDECSIKPLILQDIASEVGLDISTISRVSRSKYASTPYGIKPLKFFFSEGVENATGEKISVKAIKEALKNIIKNESKTVPLADEKLVEVLKKQGYAIARRTVAKYREQMNIPTAKLRRKV